MYLLWRCSWNVSCVFIGMTDSSQRILTYFILNKVKGITRGSIPENTHFVWVTSCLTGFDSTKQINLLLIRRKASSWIQTNKTGGQPYRDTYPSEENEYSLFMRFIDSEQILLKNFDSLFLLSTLIPNINFFLIIFILHFCDFQQLS